MNRRGPILGILLLGLTLELTGCQPRPESTREGRPVAQGGFAQGPAIVPKENSATSGPGSMGARGDQNNTPTGTAYGTTGGGG